VLSHDSWHRWLILPIAYWVGSMAKHTFTPLCAGTVAGVIGL